MEWTTFLHSLLSTQSPWLPDPMLMNGWRRLSWGLVLVGLATWVGAALPRRIQRGLALLLLVWSLLPGSASPAFWLGLAFQSPSLTTAAICLVWTYARLKPGTTYRLEPTQLHALQLAGLGGIVLGWLLLLDTFAQLPVSLYAFGFSPVAVGLVACVALVPWVLFGPRHPARSVSVLLGGVVLLYALLRLPSGNLWDALIDPWLWLALQMHGLLRGARRLNALRPGPQATRA